MSKNWMPKTMSEFLGGIGWVIVVACGLALSWHSLFIVALHYQHSVIWAAMTSVSLDGAALALADLALKRSRSKDDSGLIDRFLMICLIGVSITLNIDHALIEHQSIFAGILYAIPVVAALIMFERHAQFQHRAALSRAGKVPPTPSKIGIDGWIHHPIRSWHIKGMATTLWLDKLEGKPTVVEDETSDNIPALARSWALDNEIPVNKRGKVPEPVMRLFMAERANGNGKKVHLS